MSDQLETAVQSAIDDCCATFGAGIAESDEAALQQALQNALVDPSRFEASLESALRAIPNILGFDKEAILKMVGDLWDAHVVPWNFPIDDRIEVPVKAFARTVVLYVAGIVADRIFK